MDVYSPSQSLQLHQRFSSSHPTTPFRLLFSCYGAFPHHPRSFLPPSAHQRRSSSFCKRLPPPISMRLLFHSSWGSRLTAVASSESRRSRSRRRSEANDSQGKLLEQRARSGIGNMPARFAQFLRPPKESPNYVLWGLGILALLIMCKTIIMELQTWLHVAIEVAALALDFTIYSCGWLLNNAREPVAGILTIAGWLWCVIKDMYALILEFTPVKALVKAIVFSTAVLSLGEAVRPDVLSRQRIALEIATILGLAGVLQLLDPAMFTLALTLLTIHSAVFKKAGLVGTALPTAAVLVAVAEPNVQTITFLLFLAITLYSNWRQQEPKKDCFLEPRTSPAIVKLFALAVGIRVAAEWLYTRHLVWLAL